MFLASSNISGYELGALAIVAVGLLKLLNYVIKSKIENKDPCGAFQKDRCPLSRDWETITGKITLLYEIHCGQHAYKDGVPRWYENDKLLDDIYIEISSIRNEIGSDNKNIILEKLDSICKILEASFNDCSKSKRNNIKIIEDEESN